MDGQEALGKMFNITNCLRNADQNCNDTSPHTGQNDHHQKIYTQKVQERVWRKGKCFALLVEI